MSKKQRNFLFIYNSVFVSIEFFYVNYNNIEDVLPIYHGMVRAVVAFKSVVVAFILVFFAGLYFLLASAT
jgi:hypothetical protein